MSRLRVGSVRCECPRCARLFGGVGAFDLHQRDGADGRPVCQDPAALRDKQGRRVLVERDGIWSRPAPAQFANAPDPATGVADPGPEPRPPAPAYQKVSLPL